MPTVYKSTSGVVTFCPFCRQWKISRVHFPLTLAAYSIEASSFATKIFSKNAKIFFISICSALTVILTKVLLSMVPIRSISFALKLSSFFSLLQIQQFSRENLNSVLLPCKYLVKDFFTTEAKDELLFLKVIGQMTMSSMSRGTARAKVQFLILGKHCVEILKLGAFPDFSAGTCLTHYWRLFAVVSGRHSGDILIDSETRWAKDPHESHKWLQKSLENWQKVGKWPKLVIISNTLEQE